MLSSGQPKAKTCLPFLKFMKRPQTKFHAHIPWATPKLLGQKSQKSSLGQNLLLDQTYLTAVFLREMLGTPYRPAGTRKISD